ncbi:YciI family protein [Reichenbachiella versicolor]|uniref:YciI family protein n=1 Tax=Reichenbachiella versicolor TaxID=1821036 RepID=UPI000D6E0862|nr:YciI family protein [Reichenbachiella versicolor]
MRQEQNFMMLFRFTPELDKQPTEDEKNQMKEAWGGFIGQMAISEKLVSTYQLGFEGNQIQSDKQITDGILMIEGQTLGGNMIVRAHSLEEATELAKGSPILAMGGTVEVRSIIPMEN